MQQLPSSHIRKISVAVPLLNEIPLFGYAPPFDWHHFSSLLVERLGVNAFEVRPKNQLQRSPEELKEGLSSHLLVVPLTLTPLSSPVYWAMGYRDIEKLTSWMLNGNAKGPSFSSEILQEGFYRYLLLQALDASSLCQPFQNFTPQLGEEASLPEAGSFCIDIELSFDSSTCWGRLMIPEAFRKEWVRHFSHLPSEYTPSEISRQTPLILGLKTGSVSLHQSDWKRLKPGDCLVLDRGSYDVRRSQGAALLMLGTTSLFQVKIKQNKIELLDYSFHNEEPMEETPTREFEAAEEETSPIKELPLNIVVEIARVKVTLDQLMHLSPGNVLELPIHPDQGVSLTINGQKVGRAELVYLGETLSIRLLEIG